jgi:protein gp37
MQKSKIEWTDYTINPVKGLCPVACSYCYARRMYKRFKWDETIRMLEKPFGDKFYKPGDRVFVGSTMDLFGDWIKPDWLKKSSGGVKQTVTKPLYS